jgi:hypothetical protein
MPIPHDDQICLQASIAFLFQASRIEPDDVQETNNSAASRSLAFMVPAQTFSASVAYQPNTAESGLGCEWTRPADAVPAEQ